MSRRREGQPSWWVRNRTALLVLPVAVVLALAASSSRLHDYWWRLDFRDAAVAADGTARLVDRLDDGFVDIPIEASYRLVGVTRASAEDLGGDVLPSRLTAWRVTLEVEADPDVPLKGCHVALVDVDGSVYSAEDAQGVGRDNWHFPVCVPADAPGPEVVPFSTEAPQRPAGTPPRPRTYEVTTLVVTPADATPATVRVWYFLPKYAELEV
ncbi:hypothetical protein [Nocardioides daphniae]|nr:hypothetical protein [Nocardioides daphniae]GGD19492.1 hypothetical protein GCM10007231_18300 [Nocardioides daphniae]